MQSKIVYTAARRDGKVFWTRIGTCDVMPDGELLVRLDAFPVGGECRIRDASADLAPYVQPTDRYVVTFRVGYGAPGEHLGSVVDAFDAAATAAQLISEGACCQVHDRETGETLDVEISVHRRSFTAKPWDGAHPSRTPDETAHYRSEG